MAAMRFMHLGRETHYVGEVTAPSIRKGDRLIVISGSGKTPVSAGFVSIAKQEGAAVALLTHKPYSAIAGLVDVVLPVPTEGSIQFGGSLFEASSLLVLDAVVLDLAARISDAHAKMIRRHTNLQ
jgi:6-phospho-3-hexuloisomerase